MAEMTQLSGPGGFLPATPISPGASSGRSSVGLPHPRGHPLRVGSVKEDRVRRYVESQLLHISRRFVKRSGTSEPGDEVGGYKSLGELCRDVGGLVNILWLSGTPTLQVPYLLNIANDMNEWVPAFPLSPAATFAVLGRLDHCFASLLGGQDLDSREALPGFENGLRRGMTRTDMLRCRSVVENTRVVMIEAMARGDAEEDDDSRAVESTEAESTADEDRTAGPSWDDYDDDVVHMDVARVYEHTLVKLGERMDDGNSTLDQLMPGV